MAGKDIWIPSSCIRRRAAVSFKDLPNVMRAMDAINTHPEVRAAFDRRVVEFDQTLTLLNFQLNQFDEADYYYSEKVGLLHQLLGGKSLPTLQDISVGIQTKRSGEKNTNAIYMSRMVGTTFDCVRYFTKEGSWTFPTKVTDPAELSTLLLIEGYGVYTANSRGEKSVYDEELARTFVLAFEEVLFRAYPQSELLRDVLEWMIEERGDFSEEIKRDLDLLAATPKTVQEQLASLPNESDRQKLLRMFYSTVKRALNQFGVGFEVIGARARTDESIQHAVERRIAGENNTPLLDIYRLRIIVEEPDKILAGAVITTMFPTPQVTRNGYPTWKLVERTVPNPNMPDQSMTVYRADHLNVFLPDGQIGEVQLTTRQDDETTRIFREDYRRIKGKGV